MRFRTIGLAAGVLSVVLTASANAQEFPPALELSTSQAATVKSAPKAAEMQVSNQLTSGQFGGQDVHQTGLGIILGNAGFGIGVSARKFFGGPLGVQGSFAHFGWPGFSVNELQGAVLYRLNDIQPNPSLILTPYVGGGISFLFGDDIPGCNQDALDELEDIIGDDLFDCDGDTAGALILGGVEVFLEAVPRLGFSGEFNFNTNDYSYFGGGGFVARVHWYFN